jgi:LysR family cys regulon transcriptional activator
MNFQQLRIIRETVRRGFNLTEVANALATSQSGVSKHIKDIESELGVDLFVRRGRRLLGLTEPGREIIGIVDRMLVDAGNIRRIADHLGRSDEGELVLATTHTHARYALPPVVASFRKAFPKIHLVLHQTSPDEIATMLKEGSADIGIATEAVAASQDLVTFPYYSWHHAVIVPKGHALESLPRLAPDDLAGYPIITYHAGFTGRPAIDRAFARAGCTPDIVMSALDADVIKAYVELGLGIGIVAAVAVDPARDTGLTKLPADHIFDESTSLIALRRGRFLRAYAYRFIELCRPELTEQLLRRELTEPGSLD